MSHEKLTLKERRGGIDRDNIKLSNAFLFTQVMKNEEICKELLETILGKKIRKIVYKEVEKGIV